MTRWIEFTTDELYENEGRLKGTEYKAGERYELRDDLAERWIRRNSAFPVDGPHPKKRGRGDPAARKRSPDAAGIAIPETWKMLDARELGTLANLLVVDGQVTSRNEAFDVIEAELAERAKSKP